MKTCALLLTLASFAVVAAGCQVQKTENPLSPSIAGPIPGVEISAPKLLEPAAGWQILGDRQPVTLLIENAASNSPRPLNYSFEIATDAGFTNKVFARESVTPGDGGRTALRLSDPLSSGRSYYWRAKAQDGANTGPYSAPASFNVVTPVSFDRPTPVSPANNDKTATVSPEFRLTNATRAGNPSSVGYTLEVAVSDTFANPLAGWQFDEQPNETRFVTPAPFPANTQLFWRVRAYEGGVVGPWSNTAVFRTPAPVVTTPNIPNTGGSCAQAPTHLAVVECRRRQYGYMSPDQLLQFLRAIARDLNQGGFAGGAFGILVKPNGNNCGGYSCDIICSTNGNIWDALSDSEGAQNPIWLPKGTASGCDVQR